MVGTAKDLAYLAVPNPWTQLPLLLTWGREQRRRSCGSGGASLLARGYIGRDLGTYFSAVVSTRFQSSPGG